MHPGSVDQRIGFVVAVAEAAAVEGSALQIVKTWVVGNLVVILTQRSDQAKLIGWIDIEDEGAETSVAIGGIVQDVRNRGLYAKIAAVPIQSNVVGEALGVAAETEGVIGLIIIAGTEDEFGLAVALKAGAGHDVEDAISAIAELGAVAAAIDFQVVDVFGIELRADVGGDVGVGNRDAVHEP